MGIFRLWGEGRVSCQCQGHDYQVYDYAAKKGFKDA